MLTFLFYFIVNLVSLAYFNNDTVIRLSCLFIILTYQSLITLQADKVQFQFTLFLFFLI